MKMNYVNRRVINGVEIRDFVGNAGPRAEREVSFNFAKAADKERER